MELCAHLTALHASEVRLLITSIGVDTGARGLLGSAVRQKGIVAG